MKGMIAISLLAYLIAPHDRVSSAEANWQPSARAEKWDIRYSPGMPEHPVQDGKGWRFSFPQYDGALPCDPRVVCPSIGYITTAAVGPLRGQSIKMIVEITGLAKVQYQLEPSNTCFSAPKMRLLIQRQNDEFTQEFYRWWSNPKALLLIPGRHSITVPLTPDQWSSVSGKNGEFAHEEFYAALEDVGNIGMTFGGGCFFGHGVNVSGGQVMFAVREFAISR